MRNTAIERSCAGRAVLRVIVMGNSARPALGRSGAVLSMPEKPRNGRGDDRTPLQVPPLEPLASATGQRIAITPQGMNAGNSAQVRGRT
jgi:hypothetical protein